MMKSEEVTRILENAIRIGKGVIRYGSVASYIPELAKADKNKLGICLYTIDGNQFEMVNICHNAADAAKRYGAEGNYVVGANIAGFEKVVDAMTAQGIC